MCYLYTIDRKETHPQVTHKVSKAVPKASALILYLPHQSTYNCNGFWWNFHITILYHK